MRTKYIKFLRTLRYQINKRKIYPQDLIRVMRYEEYTTKLIDDKFAIIYYIENVYYDWDVIDYSMRNRIELIRVQDLIREIEESLEFLKL